MSAAATSDIANASSLVSKSKKHKKKKAALKGKPNGDNGKANGIRVEEENENEDMENEEQDPGPRLELEKQIRHVEASLEIPQTGQAVNGTHPNPEGITASETVEAAEEEDQCSEDHKATTPGLNTPIPFDCTSRDEQTPVSLVDTEARLDALAKERTALRDEVAQLRKSLEQIQGQHKEDLGSVRDQLEQTQSEKEHAETQYRNLLGKVNTIRSQLGDRLKADAEDLAQARTRIDDLEQQCGSLREQNETRTAELVSMAEENEQRSKELSTLRNRTTLSQQNWSKEREDLIQREAFAREEFEAAKQAMQDWEVLAMDERSQREIIAGRAADLEEQVSSHRNAHEKAAAERDTQSSTVDGLQRALHEIQDARRRELRELVENSQAQIEALQEQLQKIQNRSSESTEALENTQKKLERALPFEKEVKEKNLLIGKLRHEAVILNDHLTKALRYLKKGNPEDAIDKQLVTNHFLHFLALERADPKKFQVLQIIAALLAWTDEQREQAGLARPGASNPNLRVPISPWHRTPSTPALSTDFFPESGTRKESMAELWSDFLEQESQEGVKSPKSPSVSSLANRPSS